jgi:hypothetical protein
LSQAKQQRIAASQKKNTGVAVEIAAAATAMSQTYKSATGYETSGRAAVPLAEMHKRQKPGGKAKQQGESEQGKSFNAKEKRKRDLGQASRASCREGGHCKRWASAATDPIFLFTPPSSAGEKSYVEEEKRMLRDYSATAGQGFA